MVHQINTNLIGSIQVARAAVPRLREQGGGRIIQLSTGSGQAAFLGGSLYHEGKWGIEGFIDALNQEVAGFNIGATIIEPDGARTEFRYGSSRLGPKLDAYSGTPASMVCRIGRARHERPARRSGQDGQDHDRQRRPDSGAEADRARSDSYGAIHEALTGRLAVLEAQKDLAFSPDFPANA